jgi:hypothetical protein
MNMLSTTSASSSAIFSLSTSVSPLLVSSTIEISQARSMVMDFSPE